MRISTTKCQRFGHLEFILEADPSQVPEIYLTEMVDAVERMVEKGERFSPGETFQIGWMFTQVQPYDASHLTLVEPDMETFPINWVSGITETLRHKMLQVFMLDSVSLSHRLQMPTIVQSLIACSKYFAPNFVMERSEPTDEHDSGWFIGCLDPDHNHNNPKNLRRLSLYEAYLSQRGICGFVAFPTGAMLSIDTTNGLSIFNEGEQLEVAPGSFLDEWFKQQRAR